MSKFTENEFVNMTVRRGKSIDGPTILVSPVQLPPGRILANDFNINRKQNRIFFATEES